MSTSGPYNLRVGPPLSKERYLIARHEMVAPPANDEYRFLMGSWAPSKRIMV
jgi:hypothetical protein